MEGAVNSTADGVATAVAVEGDLDDDDEVRCGCSCCLLPPDNAMCACLETQPRGMRAMQGELELALGEADGELDLAVLQTLPTSMQLELLQRLREAKMARNRESFQQRAAQPANFSSFQMAEYLKASALRCASSACCARTRPCSH